MSIEIAATELVSAMQAWDQGAWCLAGLALTTRANGGGQSSAAPELVAAAQRLVAAAGLVDAPGDPLRGVPAVGQQRMASQAAASLHLTSALVSGGDLTWATHTDEALRAQGEASAQAAPLFAQFVLPLMGDLKDRLAASGARMLDVGTGVAAMAIGYAEVFPQLNVLGLDVLDRALELARQTIAASSVSDRVSVRKQDVGELHDEGEFDLAWIPAPFIPESALRRGLPRVIAALRRGGWLVVGHGKSRGDPVQDALTRFKTAAYGGTPLDEQAAHRMLHEHGLTSIQTIPTPPGAPGITVGQQSSP
jgi:hypothetical protein